MTSHAAKRPEPLLTRAGIVSAISGLVSLLVTVGVFPATLGDQLTTAAEVTVGAVFTVIAVVGPLVHAFVSRGAVTPVDDPRDNQGNELEPAGTLASEVVTIEAAAEPTAPIDATIALAEADEIHPADPVPAAPVDELAAAEVSS